MGKCNMQREKGTKQPWTDAAKKGRRVSVVLAKAAAGCEQVLGSQCSPGLCAPEDRDPVWFWERPLGSLGREQR